MPGRDNTERRQAEGAVSGGTIPLARPFVTEAEMEAVRRVLESRHLAQGPESALFEAELAAYVGGHEMVTVSSGGAALLLAMMAAGVRADDEVIVPDYVFPAAAHCALFLGAIPVPADVDVETLSITPDSVSARLTDRTRAVIVVHTFGIPADVEGICAVCPEYVNIIEDAACALGGLTQGGAPAGTVGRFGCFSFHPRKSITTGEGGCITASGDDVTAVRLLRDYGRTGKGFGDIFSEIGLNFRLSDINAAVGRVQLQRLQYSIDTRHRLATTYMALLRDLPRVRIPKGYLLAGNTYQSFVVEITGNPQEIIGKLAEKGIFAGASAHALTAQTVYRKQLYGQTAGADLTGTGSRLADNTIALPLFDEMTVAQVHTVVDALRAALL